MIVNDQIAHLAVHLFQGFVDADALVVMGNHPEHGLETLKGIYANDFVTLLDKATQGCAWT